MVNIWARAPNQSVGGGDAGSALRVVKRSLNAKHGGFQGKVAWLLAAVLPLGKCNLVSSGSNTLPY